MRKNTLRAPYSPYPPEVWAQCLKFLLAHRAGTGNGAILYVSDAFFRLRECFRHASPSADSKNESQPGIVKMDMSMTVSTGIFRLKVLKRRLSSAPLGLVVVMLVLALLAIWLGVSSVPETTSPIHNAPPKMLVEASPLLPSAHPSELRS